MLTDFKNIFQFTLGVCTKFATVTNAPLACHCYICRTSAVDTFDFQQVNQDDVTGLVQAGENQNGPDIR